MLILENYHFPSIYTFIFLLSVIKMLHIYISSSSCDYSLVQNFFFIQYCASVDRAETVYKMMSSCILTSGSVLLLSSSKISSAALVLDLS